MKATGSPNVAPQWWWECHIYGQPSLGGGRGTGVDLADCKARFKTAWARIRRQFTEDDIAEAYRYVEARSNAPARYDRKRGK
jgi:hypothetical protein